MYIIYTYASLHTLIQVSMCTTSYRQICITILVTKIPMTAKPISDPCLLSPQITSGYFCTDLSPLG